MNLEALRCLCAVVDAGGFRQAAERLHRSQPAVSQQVKSLEREVGHTLVDRRAAAPTPAGERLLRRARVILGETDGMLRELAAFDESDAQPLRVGTSDTVALYVLPPVVRRFSAAHPGTRLAVVNRPSQALTAMVLRGDLDLGVVTLPPGPADPELAVQPVFDQTLAVVAPANHPLAGRNRVTARDLRDESFVLLDADTRTGRLLRGFLSERNLAARTVVDGGSFEVLKRYVAEGVGLSILPRMAVPPGERKLAVLRWAELPSVPTGAIWRKRAYQTAGEKAFLGLVSQEVDSAQHG
jgi:DNA-binding transcriptional LysR family regulator